MAPGPVDGFRVPFLSPRVRAYIRVLPGVARDPLGYLLWARETYGDVVALSPGRIHLISHPDGVKHVLQDHHTNYCKGRRYKGITKLIGEGLLTSDGEVWKKQRRLSQPAFRTAQVAAMVNSTASLAVKMAEDWRAAALRGESVDAFAATVRLSMQANMANLFDDTPEVIDELGEILARAEREINLISDGLGVKIPDYLPGQRRLRKARAEIDQHIYRMIRRCRQGSVRPESLLAQLVHHKDEVEGDAMTDEQVRDQLVTFFNAGYDTSTAAVFWTIYLLSLHPEEQEAVRREAISVLGGRHPTHSDAAALPATTRAIQESMRLYPPGWLFARESVQADSIMGYHIPAGSTVMLSPYVTHRHPEFWNAPGEFRPARFLPEAAAARHKMAYFPFGAGPRQCIGGGMAMAALPLIVATIARAVRWQLSPGQDVHPTVRIVLKPAGAVWFQLTAAT